MKDKTLEEKKKEILERLKTNSDTWENAIDYSKAIKDFEMLIRKDQITKDCKTATHTHENECKICPKTKDQERKTRDYIADRIEKLKIKVNISTDIESIISKILSIVRGEGK